MKLSDSMMDRQMMDICRKVSSVFRAASAARSLLHRISDMKERKVGPTHVRKAQEGQEVQLHFFLTSALWR